MLVIPAIDLLDEHCVRRTSRTFVRENVYFDDPVKMAKLWRLQNARTLHVTGHDPGDHCRRSILKSICEAVDIPVQLARGFRTMEDVESAFEAGVYRVVMDVMCDADLSFYANALDRFGASKAIACIRSSEGSLLSRPDISPIELALELERTGCRRIVYSDLDRNGDLSEKCFSALEKMGTSLSKAHMTVAGGVSGFADLARINGLSERGIDSVVIGRALYENRFSCQHFWCWNNKDELDLSRFTTARLYRS